MTPYLSRFGLVLALMLCTRMAAAAEAPAEESSAAPEPAPPAAPRPPPAIDTATTCRDRWDPGYLPKAPFDLRVGLGIGGLLPQERTPFLGAGPMIAGRLFKPPLIVLGSFTGMPGMAVDSPSRSVTASGAVDTFLLGGAGLKIENVGAFRVKTDGGVCNETERRRIFIGAVGGGRLYWQNGRGTALGVEAGLAFEYAAARRVSRFGLALTGGFAGLLGSRAWNGDVPVRSGTAHLRLWFTYTHLLLFTDVSYFARSLTFVGGLGVVFGEVP